MNHPSVSTRCGISRLCAAIFCLFPLLATLTAQEVSTRMDSRFLARGEQTILEVCFTGVRPPSQHPVIPETRGINLRPRGHRGLIRQAPGRQLEYVFEYTVSSYQEGSNTVPSFEVDSGGISYKTEPLEFVVFNPDILQWDEAAIGERTIRYAAAVQALKNHPYEGETVPVEVKLYVPEDLDVEDWGLPDLQRDGVTSWRFQPTTVLSRVNLLGGFYMGKSYPSTLTTTRSGPVSIGPGKLRLITAEISNRGFLRRIAVETNLNLPKWNIDARPLPAGAPDGFENAIGNFRITASTSVTEVQEGDPIPLRLTVSGTGNLDNLRPPAPLTTDGWKIYEPSTEPRGDERREHSGTVAFNQFLRPLEPKPTIPAFRLVYFDPATATYKTAITEPISLKIRPSTAAPPAMSAAPAAGQVPVEQMNDILGLLPPGETVLASGSKIPIWTWQTIPAAIALFLIVLAVKRRITPRFRTSPDLAARKADWKNLERLRSSSDSNVFLLAAGRFIERWFGPHPPPEVAAILAERDARCFRKDSPAESLAPSIRKSMLHTMRKTLPMLPLLVLSLLLCTNSTQAKPATSPSADESAREAYQAARYEEAIRTWLELANYPSLSADVLYHIGNACYRAGSAGNASLYYRRALLRDPQHEESLQNLRFLERKYGSIVIPRPAYQDTLAKLSLSTWQGAIWAGAWIFLLSLLVFPATRPGASARGWAIAGFSAAPLIAAAGLLACRYYPDDARFAPTARQAVVVAEDTVIHNDASRTSPEIITAPVGSLCEIIRTTGKWSYISLATKTRGWVLTSSLERLIPTSPPKPPEIRKPKADESSA